MLRKIIVWVVFASFLSTQAVSARWYGNDEYIIVPNSGIQDCRPDAERDVIGPTFDLFGTPLRGNLFPTAWLASPDAIDKNVSGKGFLKDQARVVATSGNKFYCQKWDSTLPNTNAILYRNGETLESIAKLNLIARDSGGSGLYKFEVEYRDSTEESGFSDWSAWQSAGNKISSAPSTEFSFVLPDTKGKMKWFQFRFKAVDVAGNASSAWQTTASVLKASTNMLGWYGKHVENFDLTGKKWTQMTYDAPGKSFCNEDDHVDGHWNNSIPSYVPNADKSRNPSSAAVPLPWEIAPSGAYDGHGGQGYYVRQARAVSKIPNSPTATPVAMQCEMWDGTNPWTDSISYHNGWTNNSLIAINIKAKDYGGSFSSPLSVNLAGGNVQLKAEWEILRVNNRSGINAPRLQIPATGDIPFNIGVPYIVIQKQTSTNGPDFTTWSNWEKVDIFDSIEFTTTNSTDLNGVFKFRAPNTQGTAYKFRYKVIDGAGNESDWKEWTDIYKLDTEIPKIPNIKISTNDSTGNFQAGDHNPIKISYERTDGSPIVIHYNIETDLYPNTREDKTTTNFGYEYNLPHIFTKVDNDRGANNGRHIDIRLTKITDQAGNILNIPNKVYDFYVFASITRGINTPTSETGNKVADGQPNSYVQNVKDEYGNIIIPALQIGRTVTRYATSTDNKMYLNQQTRSGGSSLFMNDQQLPIGNQPNKDFGQQASTDGNYSFTLKVYTPTANAYAGTTQYGKVSDPDAKFTLSSWLVVRDDQTKITSISEKRLQSQELNNPKFTPLFTNKITGDLLDGGFIEGAVQTSKVETTKNSLSMVIPANQILYARFDGTDANDFQLFRNAAFSGEYPKSRNSELSINANFTAPIVTTFLKQRAGEKIKTQSKLVFSTHFEYSLDGKNVVYNSDVIGRDHYHAGSESELAQQVGVKIIGHTSTHDFADIFDNDPTKNDIIKNIGTADFRNSIRASVAEAIRNINLQNVGNVIRDVKAVTTGGSLKGGVITHGADKSILYIEWNGSTVTLENLAKISGTRTIVLRGVNLYIKSDMAYANANSILGVVVQKNVNGQGGKLYIDPSVTNIVGTYVTDGSAYSYSNGTEIGATNISILKNQLHIYGSLVSYNTIGGSRANPVQCPNISVSNCTEIDAQKYDLNFLRRYYLVNGKPFGNAKVIGGETVNASENVTDNNSDLIQKFTKTSDELAKYPVIIEFNPAIIGNPPLGFDVYRQ